MNLAAIHIRAKEAGLDDAAYRDLLLRVAGVRSAKELDEDQYLAVMREIWARINAQNSRRRAPRKKSPAESKIWALWYAVKGYLPQEEQTAAYLMGIVCRVLRRSGLGTDALPDLTAGESHKVIEALKQRLKQEEFEFKNKTGVPL